MIDWEEIIFANPRDVPRVYHYQKFDKDWITSLVNDRRIRFSAPMNFNDPWDCRPCYNKSIVDDPVEWERQVSCFYEAHKKWQPDVPDAARKQLALEWLSNPEIVKNAIDRSSEDMAKAIHEKYRVYCVGAKPDCQLLWAHYAAAHTGICLEFSTENDVFCCAYKVVYLDKYPVLNFADDSDVKNILPLITKANVWAYENEYRLIAEEGSYASATGTLKTSDGFFILPQKALLSIIMGCRITEENQAWLEEFLRSSPVPVALKKAKPIPDRYELTIT